MAVCLFVCSQDYANPTGWIFMNPSSDIPLNFESDSDHPLDTKKSIFSHV